MPPRPGEQTLQQPDKKHGHTMEEEKHPASRVGNHESSEMKDQENQKEEKDSLWDPDFEFDAPRWKDLKMEMDGNREGESFLVPSSSILRTKQGVWRVSSSPRTKDWFDQIHWNHENKDGTKPELIPLLDIDAFQKERELEEGNLLKENGSSSQDRKKPTKKEGNYSSLRSSSNNTHHPEVPSSLSFGDSISPIKGRNTHPNTSMYKESPLNPKSQKLLKKNSWELDRSSRGGGATSTTTTTTTSLAPAGTTHDRSFTKLGGLQWIPSPSFSSSTFSTASSLSPHARQAVGVVDKTKNGQVIHPSMMHSPLRKAAILSKGTDMEEKELEKTQQRPLSLTDKSMESHSPHALHLKKPALAGGAIRLHDLDKKLAPMVDNRNENMVEHERHNGLVEPLQNHTTLPESKQRTTKRAAESPLRNERKRSPTYRKPQQKNHSILHTIKDIPSHPHVSSSTSNIFSTTNSSLLTRSMGLSTTSLQHRTKVEPKFTPAPLKLQDKSFKLHRMAKPGKDLKDLKALGREHNEKARPRKPTMQGSLSTITHSNNLSMTKKY